MTAGVRQAGAMAARAAAVVGVVSTLACSGNSGPALPPLQAGALRGSNVLLVTIDTLRADRIGTLTPSINRLASTGVRFTTVYAHAPMTLPAHTSVMTGLVPAHHGVHTNGTAGLGAGPKTLAELLHERGYRTGAFVGAFVLDARFGLKRGFDVYDDHVGTERGPVTFGFVERTADRVAGVATSWMLSGAQPWFAWVHFFDPHAPYRAPRSLVANPYDNEVAYTDSVLGTLLDALSAAGQLSRTLVVVTADHGESLGEHGEDTHGLFAYDATLRVPLTISGPALPPRVVDQPVAHTDLLPTIADLVGAPAPESLDGRSLVPVMRGDVAGLADRPIPFEALDANTTRNWAPLVGVIAGGWKYVDLPIPELYDLASDPHEERNVATQHAGRVAVLRRVLEPWRVDLRGVGARDLDPDAAARLRALGYTAAGPRGPAVSRHYTEDDDPKRLVDVDREYERALRLTGEGRHSEAIAAFRATIARRRDFTAAYLTLASVLIDDRRSAEAVEVVQDARRRGLSDPRLAERLGAAYLAGGDHAMAAQTLEPLVSGTGAEGASVDALNTLAIVYAETGRVDRARPLFQRALEHAPSAASIWNNLGLLELSSNRSAPAADAFAHAVTADPDFAPGWAGLGAARAASDHAGAIDAWTRAVALAPQDFDTVYNLGMLLWESGRRDEAARILTRFLEGAPRARYASDLDRVKHLLGSK